MTTASQVNALADRIADGDYSDSEAVAALREYAALLAAQEAPAQGVTESWREVMRELLAVMGMQDCKNATAAGLPNAKGLWLKAIKDAENLLAAAPPVDAQARDGELCPDCKGSGEVLGSIPSHDPQDAVTETLSCPRCKGTGRAHPFLDDIAMLQEMLDGLGKHGFTLERTAYTNAIAALRAIAQQEQEKGK